MELRDNNTRKLTSGLRRPFGVAGNPFPSSSWRLWRSAPPPWIRAAAEYWTVGRLVYKLVRWREGTSVLLCVGSRRHVARGLCPPASGTNPVFAMTVEPVSWRRPWPTFPHPHPGGKPAKEGCGVSDLVMDWFRNESVQNGLSDEEAEDKSSERTELSSHRGFFSLRTWALFCFWWRCRKREKRAVPVEGQESVPGTSSLADLFWCPSHFSQFGKQCSLTIRWPPFTAQPSSSRPFLWFLGFIYIREKNSSFLMHRLISCFSGNGGVLYLHYQEAPGFHNYVEFCFGLF